MENVLSAGAQAIAQVVAQAAPSASVVAKTSSHAYTTITEWHNTLFNEAFDAAHAVCQAVETQRSLMRVVITSHYGSTCPTFEQFKADRAALRILALERGLVDDQWVRKPYNAAIIELYGALPVSMTKEAVAKRAERDAKPLPMKLGAPKGETAERAPAVADTLEQFIAKHGVANVLTAVSKILATHTETALEAKALAAIATAARKAG